MIQPSLKTRMTLILPVVICLITAALLFGILRYFETTTKDTISTQQYLTTSVVADDLDEKLLATQKLIIAIASEVTPGLVKDPQKALRFLQQKNELTSFFDNCLILFDRDGRIVAELPLGVTRTGKNFSYREYFKTTLATKAPHISDPYISSQSHHHPSIMMTVPVFDSRGNVLAVMGGGIDLMQDNFLGRINSRRIGKTGYMFLFDINRLMIAHPNPVRILKRDIPAGANLLLDRAIGGFNGTGETVNSRGMHTLTSFKRLKTKEWILGANYPVAEAYAPIARLQILFATSIIPTLLLLFFAMRYLLNRMTAPLLDFTRHVELLPSKVGADRLYMKHESGEIATLGSAFNNLITQLDQQREETAKRETLYRTVVEFSSDMAYWISPDRRTIYYISPSCDRLTGYSDEEFYRDPDLLNRIIRHDFRKTWQEHISTDVSYVCAKPQELALQPCNGCTVWVNHVCKPVYGEEGEFRGIRGSFIDITLARENMLARQTSDVALQRQNDYLLALHETTLGLVGRLELRSLLLDIITRAAKLMNTAHGFIYLVNSEKTEMELQVKLGCFDIFEEYPLKHGEGIAGHVWERGEPFLTQDYSNWPGRITTPERDILKATVGIPLWSGGAVVGVIGLSYTDSNNDFDDSKIKLMQQFAELASLALDNARLYDAAQKELHERSKAEDSLRKLSLAVEQSPVSIVITDLQGTIEYANPHFTRLTGYEPYELLGHNPRILKSGFTSQAEYRVMWETIQAGGEWRGEFQNRKKNGELYWELALIAPIRDSNNIITHFIAVKEDINDRKKLENELLHSQKMEAIGQLAGGIAHDFNNILTAIIGYASILQLKIPAESAFKSNIDQILATAERGASLTQGLLAFSRKQASSPSRIDMNEIIRRVEKLLLRLIGEDIQLTTQLSHDPLPVMVDSMQIEQVLMNLATNVRDAMPNGGSITIKTRLAELESQFVAVHGFGATGRYARLTVSDTGHGMDAETVRRIFEPFYTTKETGKGTGLGLSIVYGIIKKHNGYILCHSKPGKGTDFDVYLPLTDDPEQQVPKDLATMPIVTGSEVILLAEDDETTRSLYKKLLEEFGYIVIEAEDGLQALEKYRKHQDAINLVILDAIMPGMKGMEVYHEIRALTPDERVLFCSGYNADVLEEQGTLDRNLHFIAKPFVPKELLMKIREVLKNAA
jgi:PAS domain S-box-containing protein